MLDTRVRRMVGRRIGRAAAAATIAVGITGASPPVPAGAAVGVPDSLVVLSRTDDTLGVRAGGLAGVGSGGIQVTRWAIEGNFSGAPGTDVLVYGPGSAPDGIVHVDGASTTRRPLTVRGTYTPVVGDFDGNGIDDVFWDGRKPVVDRMWLFNSDGSYTEASGVSTYRSYQGLVLDANGDGRDDIVWYAPGPGYDSIWLMQPGAIPMARPVPPVDGTYEPVVGRFGPVPEGSASERILWPRSGASSTMWTFGPDAQVSSQRVTVSRSGQPIPVDVTGSGYDKIFWYSPGSTHEWLTTFSLRGGIIAAENVQAQSVDGDFDWAVGDYDGDGRDDIAWAGAGRTTIWFMGGARPRQQTVFDAGIAQPVPFTATPG